jgi:hypothetical protein
VAGGLPGALRRLDDGADTGFLSEAP